MKKAVSALLALLLLLSALTALAMTENPLFKNENCNSNKKLAINSGLDAEFEKDYQKYVGATCGEFFELEKEVFELINKYREMKGLKALAWSDSAANVARIRSAYIVNHQPTPADHEVEKLGGTFRGTLKKYGSKYAAKHVENLLQRGGDSKKYASREAMLKYLPGLIMDQWQESEGHNKNLLDKDIKYCGIGVVVTDDAFEKGYDGVFITYAGVK